MVNSQKIEQDAKQAFQKGDFVSAKRLFLEEAILVESAPNSNPLHLAQIFNNVGFVCQRLKDLPAAQNYFERAYDIYQTQGSADGPDFALNLHNIGRIAYMQRKSEIAWDYWTRELAMWKRLNNPSCTHYMAACLQACGEVMADGGEYVGARRNFEQALELRQIILPPNHADIADNFLLLAQLCEAQNDRSAARLYFQKALPLFVSALGKTHPVVKQMETSLKHLS